MGLFHKKSWEPAEVGAPTCRAEAVHVMSMYKNDEGMTGSEIAEKFTDDTKPFAYCDFRVDKNEVRIVDTKGKLHFVGYLSDTSKGMLKGLEKKKPIGRCLRLNCAGNVDLIYSFN